MLVLVLVPAGKLDIYFVRGCRRMYAVSQEYLCGRVPCVGGCMCAATMSVKCGAVWSLELVVVDDISYW